MIISCNTIVDRRDHVQYPTVSKSYSDNCTCSLTEQNTTLKNLYYGLIQLLTVLPSNFFRKTDTTKEIGKMYDIPII